MIPGSNSNDLIVRSESQKIIFSTDAGNTAAMRIDVNGNVGIGTAPAFKLDVNGKVMARGGLILSGYAAQNNSLSFASGGLYLEGTTGGSIYMRPNGTGNNTGLFTLSPTGFASSGTGISSIAGNVLIGKTSQTNSSYKLDVNGNARANKIVVNTTGADYVFDSAYHFPQPDSIQGFIQKYHHLPGVPSAREMQKEGLDVGDNQMILLQKIEELTLIVIEQNKRIEKLEKEVKKKNPEN